MAIAYRHKKTKDIEEYKKANDEQTKRALFPSNYPDA